jgi:PKD repeat protein
MKQLVVAVATTLISLTTVAQAQLHCGSDVAMNAMFAKNPLLKAKLVTQHLNNARLAKAQQTGPYTIPVVFHILHLGGPENIVDAQVQDQINILNIDYAKKNADTVDIIPSFKTIADSTNIRFALATKDPQGNCTNGIIHYNDANSNWNDASPTLYDKTWDPTKYMNVYVVKSITMSSGFQAAGYTWLPGTWNTGSASDAIVVLHTYIGSIGTSNPFSSRVLTHEVGHWLNLEHTFGFNSCGANCNNDDYIYDTPTSKGYLSCPTISNPSTYQLCNVGVDENFQNFMDYSYCEKMFTHGQAVAMQTALQSSVAGRNNLWSAGNLNATGVTTPTACAPVADFKTSKRLVCINTPVTFTDASTNATPTTYAWTFQGGTPATSTNASEQVTYTTAGTYSVTLTVSNGVGQNAITKTGIIHVLDAIAPMSVANFKEGFENNSTFLQNWLVLNNDNDNKYFQTTAVSSFSGNQSLLLNNFVNTSVQTDEVVFPPLDFTGVTSATLTFRYAYVPVDQNSKDKLELQMQTNCATSFVGTPRFTRTANTTNPLYDLSPVAGNFTFNNYVPARANITEWKLVTLNNIASAYNAKSVVFKYVFTPGAGNNVYIDDVEITTNLTTTGVAPTSPLFKNEFTLQPNPSQGSSMLSFGLTTASQVSITVSNAVGQHLQQVVNSNLNQGDHSYSINTSGLATGLYLVTLTTNGSKLVKKLIVN